MARDVTIRYIGDSRSAERAARNVASANVRMSRSFGGATATLRKFGSVAAIGLAGAGLAAAKFGVDAVKAGSDLTESWNKVSVIFGKNRTEILQWASDSAKSFGLSRQAAFDAAGTFGNMFSQLGIGLPQTTKMSKAMVELSADFASFHNADITEVIEAQTAAFRGEYDALQRFVPTINAAAVEQEALAQTGKKSNKELTAGEKAAAVYTLMMEGAGQAVGDFDRTADSAANKQRTLSAQFADISAVIGQALLPMVEAFGNWLSEKGVPKIQELSGWIRDQLVPALGDIGRWIQDNVLPPLETMGTVFLEDILPVIQDITKWIGERLNDAIEKLNDLLGRNNDELENRSNPNWQGWAVAVAAVSGAMAVVAGAATKLTPIFKGIGAVVGIVGVAFTNLHMLLTGPVGFAAMLVGFVFAAVRFRDEIGRAIGAAWNTIAGFFISGGSIIAEEWRKTWDRITGTLNSWWQTTSAFFTALPGRLQAFFAAAGTWLLDGGKRILKGMFDGIVNQAVGILFPWFRFLPFKLKDFFIGAGRWLWEAGKDVIGGFVGGIYEKGKNALKDAGKWIYDQTIGRVTSLFGIGSPSKEMAKLGGYAMQGFIQGIGGNERNLSQMVRHIWSIVSSAFQNMGLGDFFGGGGNNSASGLVGFARMAFELFSNMFPGMTIGGWRARGSVPGSDHPKGKALDLMTHSSAVAAMIIGTFLRLPGAKYWIWNRQIASASSGWRPRHYSGPSPHTDHVHLSFFQRGGVVGGATGSPSLAVVHGGEAVFTPAQLKVLRRGGVDVRLHITGSGRLAQEFNHALRVGEIQLFANGERVKVGRR